MGKRIVLGLTVLFVMAAPSWADEERKVRELSPEVVKLRDDLISPSGSARHRAALELVARKNEVDIVVLQTLDELLKNPNDKELHRVGGAFDRTLFLIGTLRLEAAASRLIPLIDFELDASTAGTGWRESYLTLHPVMWALSGIGGRGGIQMVDSIFETLTYPRNPLMSDSKLHASSSVLSNVLGYKVFQLRVQQELDNLDALDKRLGQPEFYATAKQNLQRLLTPAKPVVATESAFETNKSDAPAANK